MTPAPQRGVLLAWTVIRRPPQPLAHLGSYAVGVVQLAGGRRVAARALDPPGELSVRCEVTLAVSATEVTFRRLVAEAAAPASG